MKRMIKASSTCEIKMKMMIPKNKHQYWITGQSDESREYFKIQISRIAPYDDAEYFWARVSSSGLAEFIKSGKVIDKMYLHSYDSEDYETFNEYMNEVISQVLHELDEMNGSIKPRMVHN